MVEIKISNRAMYFFFTFAIVILLGISVYAIAPNPGHSASEIDLSTIYESVQINGDLTVAGGRLSVQDEVILDGDLFVGGSLTCSQWANVLTSGNYWGSWAENGAQNPTNQDTCPGYDNNGPYTSTPSSNCEDVKKIVTTIYGECMGEPAECPSGFFLYESPENCCEWDMYYNCEGYEINAKCQKYQKRDWTSSSEIKVCVAQ
jgi:hypothetical protein